jgi:hypothetical protein
MKKHTLILSGYYVGLGGLLLITLRTLHAVGTETKSITVNVNRFGEQYLDLACLLFLWAVCIIGFSSLWSLRTKETKEQKNHGRTSTPLQQPKEASLSRSPVLINRPSAVFIGTYTEQPTTTADSRYFLLENGGTGNIFSVSVRVPVDLPEE